MAVSLKASAATVAALFALFASVDIAQAGLPDATGDVAALSGAQGDGLGGLLGDGDGDEKGDGGVGDGLGGLLGDGEDEEGLGDVLDDATGTVDDTLDGVGGVVDDAKSGVDETVAGAKDAVDQTVSGATGPVEDIVSGTPAGGVVDDVKKRVDPVIDVVEQATGLNKTAPPAASRRGSGITVESSLGSTASAAQKMRAGAVSGPANGAKNAAQGPTQSQSSPSFSAHQQQAATPHGAPSVQFAVSAAARLDGAAAMPQNRLQATPWGQPPAAPMDAQGNEDSSSSQAPALPFGPRFPVDFLATAAAGAGAAGSALTVALLCALMLLAPRSGRLARPGPILVRPDPCLSLTERPG